MSSNFWEIWCGNKFAEATVEFTLIHTLALEDLLENWIPFFQFWNESCSFVSILISFVEIEIELMQEMRWRVKPFETEL